jgi:hypothetical protein
MHKLLERVEFAFDDTQVGATLEAVTGGDTVDGVDSDFIILEPRYSGAPNSSRPGGLTQMLVYVQNRSPNTALGDFELVTQATKGAVPVSWITGTTWQTVSGVLKHKTANLNTLAANSYAAALVDIGPQYAIGFNAKSGGSTLLANGSFTGNANSWTLGSGWSYSGNKVVASNASTTLKQEKANMSTPWTDQLVYEVTFTLANVSAGYITIGTNTDPTHGDVEFSANGTYVAKIDSDAHADGLVFTANGFTGDIDTISMVEAVKVSVYGALFR